MAKHNVPFKDHQGDPYPTPDQAAKLQSPPRAARVMRKAAKITSTPERTHDTNKNSNANNITPPATATEAFPLTTDPKQHQHEQQTENAFSPKTTAAPPSPSIPDTKKSIFNQQFMQDFFKQQKKNKGKLSEQTAISAVQETRTKHGNRLVPAGYKKRNRWGGKPIHQGKQRRK